MKKYDLLIKLTNAFGVSGKEGEVRDIIKNEIKKHVDDVYVDKMGNLIAHKKSAYKKGVSKIMIAAHMDEIGLIVKNIEKEGKIRIASVGGIDSIILLNEKITIKTRKKDVRGVVTTDDISGSIFSKDRPLLPEMYIDTGLTKQEIEQSGVHIGSFISFTPNTEILGNGKLICGKALDDRIGCYILIETMKRIKKGKKCMGRFWGPV